MKDSLLTNLVGFGPTVLSIWLATLLPSQAVVFVPPENSAIPTQNDGGVSRGRVRFIPPSDNNMPRRAVGGGSRIGFIPPPENPRPQKVTNGGSREGVFEDLARLFPSEGEGEQHISNSSIAMTAVVPSGLYGLTVSARPTMMAYLPETQAHTAIFSLKDANQSVIYQQVLPLKETDGILVIRLPKDAPELSVDEYYQWFITLQTEEYITPGSPYVTAWIKRVDVTSMLTLANVSTQDNLAQARLFAQAGIWYDAAEQLTEPLIDAKTSDDTTADWTEFLISVGLDRLSEHSFLINSPD